MNFDCEFDIPKDSNPISGNQNEQNDIGYLNSNNFSSSLYSADTLDDNPFLDINKQLNFDINNNFKKNSETSSNNINEDPLIKKFHSLSSGIEKIGQAIDNEYINLEALKYSFIVKFQEPLLELNKNIKNFLKEVLIFKKLKDLQYLIIFKKLMKFIKKINDLRFLDEKMNQLDEVLKQNSKESNTFREAYKRREQSKLKLKQKEEQEAIMNSPTKNSSSNLNDNNENDNNNNNNNNNNNTANNSASESIFEGSETIGTINSSIFNNFTGNFGNSGFNADISGVNNNSNNALSDTNSNSNSNGDSSTNSKLNSSTLLTNWKTLFIGKKLVTQNPEQMTFNERKIAINKLEKDIEKFIELLNISKRDITIIDQSINENYIKLISNTKYEINKILLEFSKLLIVWFKENLRVWVTARRHIQNNVYYLKMNYRHDKRIPKYVRHPYDESSDEDSEEEKNNSNAQDNIGGSNNEENYNEGDTIGKGKQKLKNEEEAPGNLNKNSIKLEKKEKKLDQEIEKHNELLTNKTSQDKKAGDKNDEENGEEDDDEEDDDDDDDNILVHNRNHLYNSDSESDDSS
ncbi:uncharacterized protein ASCRUDRAFT_80754 [Ascoidea rubescens DSM 1968]|uniref:Uncharacterized protein n=1 Tax=Ascoidea rubescens DSM 1968 TaxID=1344418 RepID=A0A1D2VHI9_9ASCO|nr:hypothetical protein ASCRUDRAFT_80754 [Ascoidea rubescens DSM 1968]ODV60947.1 hypothetical protein ASCRUDRAFT_80754 [Ascoidea rubescens DSM 1968]